MTRLRLSLTITSFTLLILGLILTACGLGASGIIASTGLTNPSTQNSTQQTFTALEFELDQDLSIRQIAPRIYLIQHAFPWPANSLLVEMADGTLVLVDTPYTPEATQSAIQWFKSHLGARRMIAINTGYHYNNLGGNAYLVAQGIPIYGSTQTVQLLVTQGEALRSQTLRLLRDQEHQRFYKAFEGLQYTPPTRIFTPEVGLELEFEGQMVLVYHLGPAYTPDNLVVYFPMHNLLFGGGMIQSTEHLENFNGADLEAWKESLAKLSQFDYDILVPKYGELLDSSQLEHTISLLDRAP